MLQKKIINKLTKLKVNQPCSRCGNDKLIVVNGFADILLNSKIENTGNGKEIGKLPVILLVCKRCGGVTFHAAGALGLIPKKKKYGWKKYDKKSTTKPI